MNSNDEPKKTKSPYLLLQENPQGEHHLTKSHTLSNEISPYIYIYILIVNNHLLGHKECSKVSNGKKFWDFFKI